MSRFHWKTSRSRKVWLPILSWCAAGTIGFMVLRAGGMRYAHELHIDPKRFSDIASYSETLVIIALGFAGFCIAAGGIGCRHPASDRRYINWLKLTPWQRGTPLPLGPVLLNWLDAFGFGFLALLSAAMLAAIHTQTLLALCVGTAVVVFGSAAGLCVASLRNLIKSHRPVEAMIIAAGLGLAVRLLPNFYVVIPLLSCLVAVGQWGLWQGLANFPWEPRNTAPYRSFDKIARTLSPTVDESPAARRLAWRRSGWWVVVGWWTYVVAASMVRSNLDNITSDNFWITPLILGGICALRRWFRYLRVGHGPMNWLDRVRTRMFFFPRWDIIHLAPTIVLLTAFILPRLIVRAGGTMPAAMGTTVAVICLLTMWLPPSLPRWKLTGGWSLDLNSRRTSVPSPTPADIA